MNYKDYKVAPGYALIQRDPTVKKAGAFDLPEEEKTNRGTVLLVGRRSLWKRLTGAYVVGPGDKVILSQIRQELGNDYVIAKVENLLIKL